MTTTNIDDGWHGTRTIQVYKYSILTPMDRSQNETHAPFNQYIWLVFNFLLKVANSIHLVTKLVI